MAGALGTYGSARPLIAHESLEGVTADSALAELKAGNEHHMRHRYTHRHESPVRQRELVKAQHPHAIILGCADSRVPPEIVFDQGLGDLFTVRVAGNVADDAVIGSIKLATKIYKKKEST
jgi:carbonic anhydrase